MLIRKNIAATLAVGPTDGVDFRAREPTQGGKAWPVASYTVNDSAVADAGRLIDARQYVLTSDSGEVQPSAEAQNAYLECHSWAEYADWDLGLTDGATDETKARYAFVYGDLRRVHRSGLIACVYRASEWRHKAVELAADDLLQRLDAHFRCASRVFAGLRSLSDPSRRQNVAVFTPPGLS